MSGLAGPGRIEGRLADPGRILTLTDWSRCSAGGRVTGAAVSHYYDLRSKSSGQMCLPAADARLSTGRLGRVGGGCI